MNPVTKDPNGSYTYCPNSRDDLRDICVCRQLSKGRLPVNIDRKLDVLQIRSRELRPGTRGTQAQRNPTAQHPSPLSLLPLLGSRGPTETQSEENESQSNDKPSQSHLNSEQRIESLAEPSPPLVLRHVFPLALFILTGLHKHPACHKHPA
jgi:hypothetical protein